MNPHSPERQALGREAEEQALAFLQGQGLRLVVRNWSCRVGELDLVLLDGDTLVFAEVRYRQSSQFGGALHSVDTHKQRKLIRAAQQFLQQKQAFRSKPCRFDVLAFGDSKQPEWIKNAFELPQGYA